MAEQHDAYRVSSDYARKQIVRDAYDRAMAFSKMSLVTDQKSGVVDALASLEGLAKTLDYYDGWALVGFKVAA